jgi:magnesium chelatase subunit I
MTTSNYSILPYSLIVGQGPLKLALELAFIAPGIGGVLLSGQRGTAKSTAVRAFAEMVSGELPVTIPLNATEDRVVGGWDIKELMRGKSVEQDGLLKQADGRLLYIDEVNLLDDHIVNLILDVASTGVLEVQREGRGGPAAGRGGSPPDAVRFTLVGTMNPEEGGLRPQLLDRFGLMVEVQTEAKHRLRILKRILRFEDALTRVRNGRPDRFLNRADQSNAARKRLLEAARERFLKVRLPKEVYRCCADLPARFQVEGHRAAHVLAQAARANAALRPAPAATVDDVKEVARLALQHRRPGAFEGGRMPWSKEDEKNIQTL